MTPSTTNSYRDIEMVDASALDGFDLRALPDAFYENPFPWYHRLRHDDPVRAMPDGSILLTRHRDLDRVYRDTQTFSSDKQIEFKPKFGDSLLFDHHTTSLVFSDPPLHTRVRRAIVGALAPRALASMEQQVGNFVDQLINEIQIQKDFDLVENFAQILPIQVISTLLCVRDDERDQLRGWSLAILGALEPTISDASFEAGNVAVNEFLSFLEELVARRRRELRDGDDDLLSRLVRDVDAGNLLQIGRASCRERV